MVRGAVRTKYLVVHHWCGSLDLLHGWGSLAAHVRNRGLPPGRCASFLKRESKSTGVRQLSGGIPMHLPFTATELELYILPLYLSVCMYANREKNVYKYKYLSTPIGRARVQRLRLSKAKIYTRKKMWKDHAGRWVWLFTFYTPCLILSDALRIFAATEIVSIKGNYKLLFDSRKRLSGLSFLNNVPILYSGNF